MFGKFSWRLIKENIREVVMMISKQDFTKAAGSLQLCAG